jgi:hypothetical protein
MVYCCDHPFLVQENFAYQGKNIAFHGADDGVITHQDVSWESMGNRRRGGTGDGIKQCLNENPVQALRIQPFFEVCTNRWSYSFL